MGRKNPKRARYTDRGYKEMKKCTICGELFESDGLAMKCEHCRRALVERAEKIRIKFRY